MAKKAAIIGAGASGIIAMKCCLDEGLVPVCFERTGDIGGLWNYTESVRQDQACVMKSTVINTSKEMMAFSDFVIPKEFPNFMHNRKVLEYFRLYAKHFNLAKYIRFHTDIAKVEQADDFAKSGQWKLEVKDIKSGASTTEIYDALFVCTGHHAEKHEPDFPGKSEFQGKIIHPHDYKSHVGYEGKKVVVIGIGNSGGDVAVELARVADQVYLSTRRGTWVINRVGDNGMPTDINTIRRMIFKIIPYIPYSIVNTLAENKVNQRFDHAMYGIRPENRFFAQHPMVNDDLPNRLVCGSVILKPNIKAFTKHGVEFDDGTKVDDIDVVIMATGYKFGFPFLPKKVIDVQANVVNLYKYVFPPDLTPNTLAVIGCIQPWGAINPIAELQCRWAARVFSGKQSLPGRGEMWADIGKKKADMQERYTATQRHTIQVDWIPFMDELAEHVGCKPTFWPLFKDDPKLALEVFFGPCTPYQYRLVGPGKWAGARQAIMTTHERVVAPFETRKAAKQPSSPSMQHLYILLAVVFVIWALFFSSLF